MSDLYFTFPDGALRYDCVACGQQCCRGRGFAAGPELFSILKHAPELAAHVTLVPGGIFALANLGEGCWFLEGDGYCRIEKGHGRAQKPVTCRLFPFNRVCKIGDVRVIDYNSLLCPLEAAGAEGVRHADLIAEVEELAGSPLVDVAMPQPDDLPEDWLATERAHAQAAALHANDCDALAAAWGNTGSAERAKRWGALYGFEDEARIAAERLVAPSVALMSGSLRFNSLFRKEGLPYKEVAPWLSRRLRALVFIGALSIRTGARPPSLRGLTELWRSQASAIRALSRWDEPVRLASPRFDADLPPSMTGTLALMLGLGFRGGRSIGQLIETVAQGMPAAERPLAVALAANQLDTLLGLEEAA